MNKKRLEKYAELKLEEKRIAEALEELKPQIIEDMRAEDLDKVETDFGAFTISSTSRYQYSEAVTKLQEKEKATGIAKQTVSTVLRFTSPKES